MRHKGFAVALVGAVSVTQAAQAGPKFQRIEAPAHVYDGGWEHYVGGGVAVLDCDGDKRPELVLAGGENPVQLMRNVPGAALRFEAATPEALALTGVIGVYPLDIDSDGVMDLAVLRVGENKLLRGGPDCGFEAMQLPGFDGGAGWSTAFSATWEAGNGLPTLAFGNYVDRDDPEGPFEACDDNVLFRPDGEAYDAQVLTPGFCPLSMLFSDWGQTGQADLRISNDRHYYVRGGAEQMWSMGAVPRLLDEQDGWRRFELWGMGIASRDLDFDGRPEVFLSSMGDQRLQRLEDGAAPRWADVPYAMGTTAHRPYVGGDGRPSTGWHISFGDVQNDGLDDAFIAKGNVQQMPGAAMADPNNLLIQNDKCDFTEAGELAGIATTLRSRGPALVDLDGDGLLDLVVVNRRAPLEVYRNITAETGAWLSVALQQDAPNVNAVGAFIELTQGGRTMTRTVTREITVGGGHAGGVAGPEHFGLGKGGVLTLRVRWPDGVLSEPVEVSDGQAIQVTRAATGLLVTAY